MYQPIVPSLKGNSSINHHINPAIRPVRLALITDQTEMKSQINIAVAGSMQTNAYTMDYYPDFSSAAGATSSAEKMVVFVRIAMDGFFEFLQKVDRTRIKIIALIDDIADELLAARLLELDYVLKTAIRPDTISRALRSFQNHLH
ncbi:MAG: hypothetical protein DI535_09165 [Citrobacter freundii]|nr:MAG: hypothetical protein DI535_09165 [Citrobacter freundii]